MRWETRRKLARDTKIGALFKRISDERMIAKSDLAIAGPAIALLDFQGDEFARAIVRDSA
jgi:hypothetical protein